jgi:nicotinate-nucleotide adenylyltransferase
MCAVEIPSGIGKIKKIGVLGGTFDPIHNGHLAIAEEARQQIGMLEVIFVPAGKPWMKKDVGIASAAHRLEMVKLAVAGKPYFQVSTMEIERETPTYSIDTITKLKEQFGGPSILYFIMSWETLAQLPEWKEPDRLIEMCYLVVTPRPGSRRPDMTALQDKIPCLSDRVIFLDKPEVNISATDVRKRIVKGLPINQMVPEKVEKYIKENGLYRG